MYKFGTLCTLIFGENIENIGHLDLGGMVNKECPNFAPTLPQLSSLIILPVESGADMVLIHCGVVLLLPQLYLPV